MVLVAARVAAAVAVDRADGVLVAPLDVALGRGVEVGKLLEIVLVAGARVALVVLVALGLAPVPGVPVGLAEGVAELAGGIWSSCPTRRLFALTPLL